MNLTFNVKNKSLVMPIKQRLTFDVMSDVKFSADIRRDLGKFMQAERENRGLSQKYVAGKIGKSVTQLSRIENGKSGTERDTVIIWAEVVGVDVNETLRKFKPENIQPYPKELVMDYDGFDDDDLKEIAEFIKFRKQRKEAAKTNAD